MSTTITTENATIFLEDQLDVICDEDGRDYEDIFELKKRSSLESLCVFTKPIWVENGDLW